MFIKGIVIGITTAMSVLFKLRKRSLRTILNNIVPTPNLEVHQRESAPMNYKSISFLSSNSFGTGNNLPVSKPLD